MSGTNTLLTSGAGPIGGDLNSLSFYTIAGVTFGYTASEAVSQTEITTACTLSKSTVAYQTTNFNANAEPLQFRVGGGNGNQILSLAGSITTLTILQDSTHSDSITANSLCNWKHTATGANNSATHYWLVTQCNNSTPTVMYVTNYRNTSNTFATSSNYNSIQGDGDATQNSTTETESFSSMGEAGTLSGMQMNVSTASSGTISMITRKNQTNGSQTISIASGTGITVDSTHTDSVVTGDNMTYQYSSTNASGEAQVLAVCFNGTHSAETTSVGTGPAASGVSGTHYMIMASRPELGNATENQSAFQIPYALTTSLMRMLVDGQDSTVVIASRNNGANGNQQVACIGGTLTVPPWTVDVTHTDSVSSGNTFCMTYNGGNFGTCYSYSMTLDDGSSSANGGYFSPIIDQGSNTGITKTGTSTSSLSWSNTFGTSGPNESVVLFIAHDSSSSVSVSSVTEGTSALTFSLYKSLTNTTSGAHNITTEIWIAPANSQYNSAASSNTWTINLSGTVDAISVIFSAFVMVQSTSTPWDGDMNPNPATAQNSTSTTPPTVTFSTAQAQDLLIMCTASGNEHVPSVPSGWTQWKNSNAAGSGGAGAYISVYYKSVRATQSSATVADASATADVSWQSIVTAITGAVIPVTINESITETLSASDSPTENVVWARSLSETLAAADAVAANGQVPESQSETLSAADAISFVKISQNCPVVVVIMK